MTMNLSLFFLFFLSNSEVCVQNFSPPPSSYNHTESDNPHTEKQSCYVLKIYFFSATNPGFHQAEDPHTQSHYTTQFDTGQMLHWCWLSAEIWSVWVCPKTKTSFTPKHGSYWPYQQKKILLSASLKKPPLTIFFTLLEKLDLVEVHTIHWRQRHWL